MSDVGPEGRSYARIELDDLKRLATIAAEDRAEFFAAHRDWASLYRDRVIATALCQGAAQHYISGTAGIHDFDVYTFYAAHPRRQWYAKRNKRRDYGLTKFGQSPDRPDYMGRRVDLLGRGIPYMRGDDPAEAIRRWLRSGATTSAKLLAATAVILLSPRQRVGEIVWPLNSNPPAA